jgi:hypothetical protein
MADEKVRWDGWLGPKQWMPIVGVLSVAIIGLAIALILNLDDADGASGPNTSAGRTPTHMHANFAVFINGQQVDFSPYMIGEDDTPKSDNVHLHVPRPDVVHVHTTLTTWDVFFTSIGFQLTDPSFAGITLDRTCLVMPDKTKLCSQQGGNTWKFIANGVPVDGLADVNIGDLDRMLFSYGPETVEQVMETQFPKVNNTACIVSELCLDRVVPNEPPEPCKGEGQCVD